MRATRPRLNDRPHAAEKMQSARKRHNHTQYPHVATESSIVAAFRTVAECGAHSSGWRSPLGAESTTHLAGYYLGILGHDRETGSQIVLVRHRVLPVAGRRRLLQARTLGHGWHSRLWLCLGRPSSPAVSHPHAEQLSGSFGGHTTGINYHHSINNAKHELIGAIYLWKSPTALGALSPP